MNPNVPHSAESTGPQHVPVLVHEVLEWLEPKPGQVMVDGTVGAAGHARAIAERLGPDGRLIGLDRDPMMLELARGRVAGLPIELVHADFADIRAVLDQRGVELADGVLLDLGVSSDQLADSSRGFSFTAEGPLDLRMNPGEGKPAADLVNRLSERALADLFWQYGEERFSRRIARRIVEARRHERIETAAQFASLVRGAVPARSRARQRIDPATRVFQALRIAVNDELGSLERCLEQLPGCLRPSGRAVVISFHSLEDRLVKQAFRVKSQWQVLTKKPIRPTRTEVASNPRARSAKLRAAQRTA
jgi:16S rRNA (cytosine1402-N4)-methyltransferase